ncbi:MAG: protein kinase [Gemmataceae bacterium]|nr:protein kinase [Gemmataceae bacterium]
MSALIEADSEPIPGYRLIDRLGSGGFGEVWRCKAPGGLFKAIKIVHGDVRQLDSDGSHRAEQELRALQRVQAIRHPYLLSIERYDVIDGRLMIVSELADCNLFDRYETFANSGKPGIPREELLRYLREAAEVLDLMNHTHQLQHLDIKPQNLFLIHDHVKVADFGLVKDLEGVRTEMQGGVTPLYAAPETFEGVITQFCDQYSLAIVYQELLTGHRPFQGTTVQQLVLQHVQAPPNLSPLPHADRPAVAKALSKKPENRHPSCMALIRALEAGSTEPPQPRVSSVARHGVDPQPAPPRPGTTVRVDPEVDEKKKGIDIGASIRRLEGKGQKPFRPDTPPTIVGFRREELPTGPQVAEPTVREAPPEFTGNGVLFPALVVGLGRAGLVTLKRLRQVLCERFGGMSSLPHIKLLYIDTDPETADTAVVGGGGSAMEPDEILLARLNRASHYLKPRRNGRSLIEGWFDAQWLYRIPRNPQVLGQRALGRLVFGDCYSQISGRIEEMLEQVVLPDNLLRSDKHTSLGLRTNRPRAYVVSHLAGGTGGGMFLDLAYLLRHQFRMFGYKSPQPTGLLVAPGSDAVTPAQVGGLANTFAALTELVHYHHPDARHTCTFDDRDALLVNSGPPFERTIVLPGNDNPANSGSRDGSLLAADFLARELTQHFGRAVDGCRVAVLKPARPTTEVTVGTFGLTTLSWPRKALIRCASRRLCEMVVDRWSRLDVTRLKPLVRERVDALWDSQELRPDLLESRLQAAVASALGEPPGAMFARMSAPFTPKGWFGGSLDVNAAYEFVTRCEQLFGHLAGDNYDADIGIVGTALLASTESLVREFGTQLAQLAVSLIEQPEFRMSGAEEAVHQLRSRIDEFRNRHASEADRYSELATRAFERIQQALSTTGGRKSANEFAEAAKSYPGSRLAALVHRRIAEIGLTLSNDLGEQANEIGFCRQRLDELIQGLKAEGETLPSAVGLMLPPGCNTAEEAIDGLLSGVSESDLQELDRRMQRMVQSQFTALVHVCLSTSNILANLAPAMLKLAQQFMAARVGESNAAELFKERFSEGPAYQSAVEHAYDAASPVLADSIGVMTGEVIALSVPPGPAGDRFADVARNVVTDGDLVVTVGVDDVAFYRELPRIPLARLPQFGPRARDCFQQIADRDRSPPHTRTDVEQWLNPR